MITKYLFSHTLFSFFHKIIFIAHDNRRIEMEKLNGEIVAGIAFIFISLLFIFAASVNSVWAIILPADYLIMAIGVGLVILGVMTLRKEEGPVHHH